MKRFRLHTLALLAVPFLALALITAGCTGDKKKDGSGETSKEGKDGGKGGSGGRAALEIKERGTLKGTVTVEGTPSSYTWPTDKLQAEMRKKDEAHCLAGASEEEKSQYEWKIDPTTKGLQDVFIWLEPPSGKYFKLTDADTKDVPKEKVIDQPHCAFVPHALTLFPSYWDGKRQVPTGQEFVIKNSAQIAHNSHYNGGPLIGEKNEQMAPGSQVKVPVKASAKPQHITVVCDAHPWMKANVWVFEHPFATVSGKGGGYELKNVPTGVPLKIVVWHPKAGYLKEGGEEITIKDGEKKDFKITAK